MGRFKDRCDAGRKLAQKLGEFAGRPEAKVALEIAAMFVCRAVRLVGGSSTRNVADTVFAPPA